MGKMGYPDKPVADINDDLFNVEVYVNALCSFIQSCETPMTISIQGDWGSGKTSMMNMIKANMPETVWPIWFNTWQFSQFNMGGGLAFSMMEVILKGLDCDEKTIKKIGRFVLGGAKELVKGVSGYLLGDDVSDAVSDAMDGKTDSIDLANEIVNLKERFETSVSTKLEKENRDRVVVFVDDLDRLQPEKAVELLEVLKLFLDCDKCVFVLAVDYEVVTLGIKQKFGGEVSEEKGRSFFDKIIQLPFKMPVSNYDIHKYVKKMMERIKMPTEDAEVDRFYHLIQSSIGFNPRSMKRLFNTFELLDIVTESTVYGIDVAVRRRILFGIICMQMRYEKMYRYLASTRIDEDTFASMRDENTITNSLNEIYEYDKSESSITEIEKLKSFMPHFIDALQVDEDSALSEEELNNLKIILKCSLVTSVNATSDESESDNHEWEFRNRNKDIVKAVASKLTSIGEFKAWMPRKERDGVKFSDISGWYTWGTQLGYDCTLEYYLSRLNESIIGVSIFITLSNGKGQETLFFDSLGENPLSRSTKPQTDEWGRYRYNNLLRINANDQSASDQIASLVRKSYENVLDTMEKAQNS